ncbi:hypothetical protein B0H13DRAFT_2330486 [Mycena leptocephala]|nr:hypothetical protein B0H13DRAFT_2330486 [Mycena leptocephala]
MATIATYIKVRRRMYETVLAGAINTSARRVLLGSILVDSSHAKISKFPPVPSPFPAFTLPLPSFSGHLFRSAIPHPPSLIPPSVPLSLLPPPSFAACSYSSSLLSP